VKAIAQLLKKSVPITALGMVSAGMLIKTQEWNWRMM
jgi:hypothetical protein